MLLSRSTVIIISFTGISVTVKLFFAAHKYSPACYGRGFLKNTTMYTFKKDHLNFKAGDTITEHPNMDYLIKLGVIEEEETTARVGEPVYSEVFVKKPVKKPIKKPKKTK